MIVLSNFMQSFGFKTNDQKVISSNDLAVNFWFDILHISDTKYIILSLDLSIVMLSGKLQCCNISETFVD